LLRAGEGSVRRSRAAASCARPAGCGSRSRGWGT